MVPDGVGVASVSLRSTVTVVVLVTVTLPGAVGVVTTGEGIVRAMSQPRLVRATINGSSLRILVCRLYKSTGNSRTVGIGAGWVSS